MEVKKRVSYPLGMFDLVKGMGMIGIVLSHTTAETPASPWLIFLIELMQAGMMGIYYGVNGFHFRPTASFSQSVKKHAKEYLPFYFRLAAIVLLYLLVTDRDSLPGFALAFVLGVMNPVQLGSVSVMYISMGWFLLALLWSSILLDLVLKIKDERIRIGVIVALLLCGVALETRYFTYYALCRGLQALPGMYIGYCIHSRDLLEKPATAAYRVVSCLLFAATLYVCAKDYFLAPDSGNYFICYCLFMLCDATWAYLAIFFSRDTLNCSSVVLEWIRKIGRYTPWIVILHSLEMLCKIIDPIQAIANEDLRFAVQFLLRSIFIFLGCILMDKLDRYERQWKRKRRSKKRARKRAAV